jgi:hypothetical protein
MSEAPFLTAWGWRRLVHRDPGGALTRPAALWALQPVPGDDPIWIPFAREDIFDAARRARAVFAEAGIRAGDVVLSVAPEGPWVGNATPYLISGVDALTPGESPLGAEVLPLSVLTVSFKHDLTLFPFQRSPSVLVGTAADVLAVAATAQAAGAPPLRSRLLLLTGPAVERAVVRDLAPECVDLLYLPGAFAPFGGRPGASGVWLSSGKDAPLEAELIPDEEWGRSVQDPAYRPRALPLDAALGLSGELVVCVENHALPIVRFRTQERVRVVEVSPARGIRVDRIVSALVGRPDGRMPVLRPSGAARTS